MFEANLLMLPATAFLMISFGSYLVITNPWVPASKREMFTLICVAGILGFYACMFASIYRGGLQGLEGSIF